jgi:hypothetical protein
MNAIIVVKSQQQWLAQRCGLGTICALDSLVAHFTGFVPLCPATLPPTIRLLK